MKRQTGRNLYLLLLIPAFAAFGAGNGKPMAPADTHPAITVMKNQRVLVVTLTGDPGKVADKAMKILFGAFFRNATEAEKNAPIIPRVRWSFSPLDARKRDWIGNYALPVSDAFPDPKDGQARVEEWRYGLVAEILHRGPYENESRSIDALKDYIAANGFTIAGDFEEEYLQGRGTLYEGKPEGYLTVLRYRIENIQDFPRNSIPLTSLP